MKYLNNLKRNKMKNLHILTNNCSISNLVVIGDKLTLIRSNYYSKRYIKFHGYQSKAIYITNDEEPKNGDWILNSWNEIHKLTKNDKSESYKNTCKKIILTTDQDIIKDGVQPIPDEFLEWFVKNPNCDSVVIEEKYRKCCRNTDSKNENCIETINCEGWLSKEYERPYKTTCDKRFEGYKIIIPQEESKQERKRGIIITHVGQQEALEEVSEKYASSKCTPPAIMHKGLTDAVKFGAKWQQEQDKNKFSKEDMMEAFHAESRVWSNRIKDWKEVTFSEWFEQFKKK